MVKFAVIDSSELGKSDENPTACWLPKRYVGECTSCDKFKHAMAGESTVKGVISNLKCRPKIPSDKMKDLMTYLNAKQNYTKAQEALKRSGQKLKGV